MNNFEKIKSLSIDELADLLFYVHPKGCGFCVGQYEGCLKQVSCVQSIKEWLKSNKAPYKFDENSPVKWKGYKNE